jgi:hypothetical protein
MKSHFCTEARRNRLLKFTLIVLLGMIAFAGSVSAQTPANTEEPLRSVNGKPAAEQVSAVVAKPQAVALTPDPIASLKSARFVFVKSESLLVGQSVIESKLRKRREFQQLGLMITRDVQMADLILEVKHDILTKYVFTAVDPHTNVVVASGKLSSLGGTVAGKVAKRFMKQVMLARQGTYKD